MWRGSSAGERALDGVGWRGGSVSAPVVTRDVSALLADFDALPAAYREIVRSAPYNIDVRGLTRLSLSQIRRTLRSVEQSSIRATWGDDHPSLK